MNLVMPYKTNHPSYHEARAGLESISSEENFKNL